MVAAKRTTIAPNSRATTSSATGNRHANASGSGNGTGEARPAPPRRTALVAEQEPVA
jgi:hypothetical protein